jgi:hypothetical protein
MVVEELVDEGLDVPGALWTIEKLAGLDTGALLVGLETLRAELSTPTA